MSDSRNGKDKLTVIVVGEETAPVRRFHIPRSLVARATWIGAGVALLLLAGATDYVRLRLNAVDVTRLRAETAEHRQEIERLHGQLEEIETDVGAISELERKIRIIANLPGSVIETEVPGAVQPGQGGGDEELDAPSSAAPPAPAAEPVAPSHAAAGLRAGSADSLDPASLARISTRARQVHLMMPARVASLEDLLDGLQGQSDRLASTPSIWPADGWVTSGFGRRTSPFTGQLQFHEGVDIAARFGTPVFAPARGRVVFVGRKGPLGNAVVIDHGYGMRTTYGHNSEIFVKVGQRVERGTRISAIGSTGRSTGPHLHYAISVAGQLRDPMDYILE